MYFISQKLGNDTEVGLLQVFKTRKLFVEILSQVEHFLGHIEDLILSHPANLDQSSHNLSIDQILFLELLTDLEGHVDWTNRKEAGVSSRELQIMHRHFG